MAVGDDLADSFLALVDEAFRRLLDEQDAHLHVAGFAERDVGFVRTFTFTAPRLVGAFVLALGLLVAGLAVGLGPAGAVMDRGGDEPSITELNWQCNDETRICECIGAFWSSDCVSLYKANPDCKFVHAFADGAEWCRVPDGGPIFHPDGTKAAPPTDGPPVLNPGDLPDVQDPTRPGSNEPGQDPDGPGDDGEYEEPERPLPADPPPPGLPPSVDPDDVIKPGDLPGAEDPGRTGNGSADSSTGSVPLDPGGLDR